MKFESMFFKNISIISESLRDKLGYPSDAYILPLGADVISDEHKSNAGLHLIYVGTLHGREIEKTVEGLSIFLAKNPNVICSYNILGTGFSYEVDAIKEVINRRNLSNVVKLQGFIAHEHIADFFANSNLGVSYVPKTDFYDKQPVTKTFEYLLSGLPVIATSTSEHLKIVSDKFGVLTEDDPESFSTALEKAFDGIKNNRFTIDKAALKNFTWENVCLDLNNHFEHLIKKDRVRDVL